ncbi:MAG: TraB/GumN family protein [Bacteroidetes bacterium]|nr:TraB/GumN family protein [Bacteroidota bacterium]
MKFFPGCLLALLLAPALYAQQTSSLLWKVSGNGLQQPSYLFGTFHILCKADFSISAELENTLKTCKSFYSEIKMDEPGLQLQLLSKMTLTGRNIPQLVGETEYNRISPQFKSITGMPMAMLDPFKPFLHLSLLAQKAIACSDQVQPETELLKLAQQYRMNIQGLETINDQIEAIDKEPLDSQLHSLVKMLQNFDSVQQVMSKLVAVYKVRDIDSIYRFMKQTGMDEDFKTAIITKRNEKWIPLMQQAMLGQPCFFAVGAGHLGGAEGVISLLRKRGYRLTPLKF